MANTPAAQKKKSPHQPKKPVHKKGAPQKQGIPDWVWLAGILILTFIVFFPTLNNALTNWDDPKYLTENPLIRKLNAVNIKRIFTEVYFGNYQPLHILSYAIEYHFYKLNPAGYHATSVIMHLVVTGLVFRFIFLLTENSSIALITALLFGIHPMHVESVAWAAERKDLLYAMFLLGSLIFYIKYIRSNQKMKYFFIAFLLFALSIMSKAMAASLPPLLILIDYFFGRKFNTKIVLEKIPFFALALVFGLISAHTVSTTGQVTLNVFSLPERIMFANFNVLAYTAKLILPIDLSAFYPYPVRVSGSFPFYYYLAPVVVLALLFLIIRSAKKTKVIIFGAGFFVASIFLVLQLFPVGPTIISERYSYVPSIGFFFVIATWFSQLIAQRPSMKTPLTVLLGGYCLFLSVTTFQRSDVWKDSMTLWTNVINQFPHVGTALNNRGNVYGKEMGDLDHALADFNASIQFDPAYPNAYANRGIVYSMRGKFDLGIQDYNRAIELKPDYFDALFNRGITYTQLGKLDSAIADFNRLEKIAPDDSRVYANRGWAYLRAEKNDEALADLTKSISMDPSFGEVYYRRSNAYYNKKLYQEAYRDVVKASSLGFAVDQAYFETIKKAAGVN